MKDWIQNAPELKDFYGFIDWLQTKKEFIDIYENKRYAITLKETDELIGMVGIGLEDTVYIKITSRVFLQGVDKNCIIY